MLSMQTNCTIPNHMIPPSSGRPAEPAPLGVSRMWTPGPHAQNAGRGAQDAFWSHTAEFPIAQMTVTRNSTQGRDPKC